MLRVHGHASCSAHRPAHRAELPAASVRGGDPGGALRTSDRRHPPPTAPILDTRKTTPGLRELEKAAVAAGGATNHRAGLYDAILIKENHATIAGGVGAAVRRARDGAPGLPLEVECRNRAEVDEALAAGAPRLLLDNMSPEQLTETARHVGGRAELEASGGVTLQTLREPWRARA